MVPPETFGLSGFVASMYSPFPFPRTWRLTYAVPLGAGLEYFGLPSAHVLGLTASRSIEPEKSALYTALPSGAALTSSGVPFASATVLTWAPISPVAVLGIVKLSQPPGAAPALMLASTRQALVGFLPWASTAI